MNRNDPCKHSRLVLIPVFPSSTMACIACLEPLKPGMIDGIRDYYIPGDPHWRRHSDVLKFNWANGDQESLYQCQACCVVGTVDDFDCLGGEPDELFCQQCHSTDVIDCN